MAEPTPDDDTRADPGDAPDEGVTSAPGDTEGTPPAPMVGAPGTATADDPTGIKARRAATLAAGSSMAEATPDDPTGTRARRAAAAESKKVPRPSKRTGGIDARAAARSGDPKKAALAEQGRYTAPIPRSQFESPTWVPALMFTLLGLGMVIIFLTYVLWEGKPLTLGIGLAFILGGILTATQYR